MAIAALCLVGLFFLPMWEITLEAPQYPEGNELGILIHVDKVEGAHENDLQNLNGLNHYIGMKKIEPDSIPELAYMKYVVYALIGLGLLVAGVGKRSFILVWLALLTIAGALGLYDFYTWLYDYGHNLDPHAAIKIPGMAYQPPLIGVQQLLNFKAHSWPAFGFYMIGIGAVIAAFTWWISRPKRTIV
jgi:hypothetical protein